MNLRKIVSGLALVGMLAPAFSFAATLPDNTKSPKNFFAQGYQAQWVSQTQAGTSDQLYNLNAGDTVKISFVFKNTGTETWNQTGTDQQVCFNIYKDANRKTAPSGTGYDTPGSTNFGQSYWTGSAWINSHRPACIKEATVAPGANGTFDVEFKIPSNTPSGTYYEDISLASGPYWMANPTNGDPLGVSHVWAGWKVKGNELPEGDEATINMSCFDNELVLEQSTACYLTLADKFGDPIEERVANELYVEFLTGSAKFYDALGTGHNIAELDQDLAPGIYPFAVQAGTTAETVKVKATDMEVIPQVSQTMSLIVSDKNMILEAFPDTLTVGLGDALGEGDEAVLTVSLVDANGDPQTGKEGQLKAEVTQGDAKIINTVFTTVPGTTTSAFPFDEVVAPKGPTGIYNARVQAGTTAGEIKVKVTDIVSGASQTVSIDALSPGLFLDLFPSVVYSNDSGDNGVSNLVFGLLDANGKPVAQNLSGIIEVSAQLTLEGAVLDCDGNDSDGNPFPIDVNGAGFYMYGCEYTAPFGDDRVKSAKVVPIRIRNVITGEAVNVNLQVNIGDNQSTGIPSKMEVKQFGDKINRNDINSIVTVVNLADTKNNPVLGEEDSFANGDFDGSDEWNAFEEIGDSTTYDPTDGGVSTPGGTGIYVSLPGDEIDEGSPEGDKVDYTIKYEGSFINNTQDVELEEDIFVEAFDYLVEVSAFPPSISMLDTTTVTTKVSNAYGGKAGGIAALATFGNCVGNDVCYELDSSTGVDVNANFRHPDTDDQAIFFTSITSDDDDDVEVVVDLGDAPLDDADDGALIIPVDADNSITLSAFPENVTRGYVSSVIIKLENENGAPIDINDKDIDAGSALPNADEILSAESEEDDDLSLDEIPSTEAGIAFDGNLMDLMFELHLNETTRVLEASNFSGTGVSPAAGIDEPAGFRTGGIYFLPYGAPIEDVEKDMTDCVTVTYEGVEKVEEQVCFNIET